MTRNLKFRSIGSQNHWIDHIVLLAWKTHATLCIDDSFLENAWIHLISYSFIFLFHCLVPASEKRGAIVGGQF